MHFHLPKPLHGWRAFVGEVGIIVIGVLIALGAEQVVETLRWKAEVADARTSLNAQLVHAAYAARIRLKEQDCTARKLDRLDDLVSAGEEAKVVEVSLAGIYLWGTSSWESATASGAVAHMSREQRGLYASVFAFTRAMGDWNGKEFDLVGEVRMLNRPHKLSAGMRDRLIFDIARLRQFNKLLTIGAQQWLDEAKPLGLQLEPDMVAELRKKDPCIMPDDPAAAQRS
jgi:hypothetical protein